MIYILIIAWIIAIGLLCYLAYSNKPQAKEERKEKNVKKSQLNVISRSYSNRRYQTWESLKEIDPKLWTEIDDKYKYTEIKIRHFKELLKK